MRTAISGIEVVTRHRQGPHFTFKIDVEKRIVFVRFKNKVTAADICRYAECLRMDSEFDPEFSEIVDLTEVEDLELRADDFLSLADEIDCFSVGAWCAFIVRNSVQSHAAHLHKILRTPSNMRTFSSLDEAKAWIESRPLISR